MKIRKIDVDRGVAFGDGSLTFIAGPCVIESRKMALDLAARLVEVANDLSVNYVFKASFDKANRTSVDSFRGPGIDKGLEILDVPCDQFGHQAPGSDEEIHKFCTLKFGADFPQFKKSEVNGANELPLYTWLKEQKGFNGSYDAKLAAVMEKLYNEANPEPRKKDDIQWNFTKFLIDRNGNVIARFEPTVDMKEVEKQVEAAL